MKLGMAHRLSAAAFVAFAAVHLANHLMALRSVADHIAFMEAARSIYRHPLIEGPLLLCVGFQALSGMGLIVRGWKARRGFVAWAQALSGCVLALFLLIHLNAIWLGRTALHLDTNFHYAAAGFHVVPYQLFFIPYYFLAVAALFTHGGCALFWLLKQRSVRLGQIAFAAMAALGCITGLAIDLALAGKIHPVTIPQAYLKTYQT